jgi:hypothetical protein
MKLDRFDMNIATNISEDEFLRLVNNGCKPEFDDVLLSKDGTSFLRLKIRLSYKLF